MRKKTDKMAFWQAVATMIGTIIGAGVLGVPYVIAQAGAGIGIFSLIFLGLAALLLNLMFSEVILRTNFRHQVAGYAKKYLGKFFFRMETASLLIGGYGGLLAYIIGEGEVISALFGGKAVVGSLIFFAIAAIILFVGIDTIKVFEFWMVGAFIIIILAICFFALPGIQVENWYYLDWSKAMLPYGVILFAYGGAAAVVPMREILRKQEKKLKSAVTVATLIPVIIYILFSLVVVGVTGLNTTDVATLGLGEELGKSFLLFGNIFALLAMATSFLSIALTIKEYFSFDLRLSNFFSSFLTLVVPLAVFLLGNRNFVETMGVAGSMAFGLTGIVLVFLFWKAKKFGDRRPEFTLPGFKITGWGLITVLLGGIIYTIIGLI